MESIVNFNQDDNVWELLRHEDGAKRYCAKYATKPYQKKVPKWFRDVGRFWGASQDVKDNREKPRIIQLTEDELKEILLEHHHTVGEWDVVPRHLWGVTEQMFDKLP